MTTEHELIHRIISNFHIKEQEYIGDKYNKIQSDFLIEKTENKRIIIVGDLLNDYMLDIKRRIWSMSRNDITDIPDARALVLYYKNEFPYKKTVDQRDFFCFYLIVKKLIEMRALKSFNKLKIICKHSVPDYYDSLECEKVCDDIGPKKFEEYLNIYANPIFITTATANHYRFGSKGIVSRNVYEKKEMDRRNSILFNHVYCPVKESGIYDDDEEFIWMDDVRSTYNARFGSFINIETKLENKLIDLIKCIFELDKNPLIGNIDKNATI